MVILHGPTIFHSAVTMGMLSVKWNYRRVVLPTLSASYFLKTRHSAPHKSCLLFKRYRFLYVFLFNVCGLKSET